MAASGKDDSKINPKLPTWDGSWGNWTDYKLQVELEVDSTNPDDLERLAPRLVRNLTGKAWEAVTDIDRKRLKDKEGVTYMLTYLAEKRGRQKVDLLGEALGAYFQRSDVSRRDGENWSDFEARHDAFIREINKALREIGSSSTVPTEIFGWFMLHQFLRLEPSDLATIKSVAATYKLEDIYTAMRKLWGGEALALKDQERKKAKLNKTFAMDEVDGECAVLGHDEHHDPEDDEPNVEEEEDAQLLYEAACEALFNDPSDPAVLANFQEARKMRYSDARKALGRARTSRGFFPNNPRRGRDPGRPSNDSHGYQGRCVRCGKIGHRPRDCRQQDRGHGRKENSSAANVSFVGFLAEDAPIESETPMECSENELKHPLILEEDLDLVDWEPSPIFVVQTMVEHHGQDHFIGAAIQEKVYPKAVIDCGASESIVGDCMLQDYSDELDRLGFDADQEIHIDREVRKSFLFGNSATSTALGLAKVTTGLCGQEQQLDLHVVQGNTPFLLSSKWLYEQEATINFKSGKAIFPKLSPNQIQLERASSFHLMMPLTAFGGNEEMLQALMLNKTDEDPAVAELGQEESVQKSNDKDSH